MAFSVVIGVVEEDPGHTTDVGTSDILENYHIHHGHDRIHDHAADQCLGVNHDLHSLPMTRMMDDDIVDIVHLAPTEVSQSIDSLSFFC